MSHCLKQRAGRQFPWWVPTTIRQHLSQYAQHAFVIIVGVVTSLWRLKIRNYSQMYGLSQLWGKTFLPENICMKN